MHNFILIFFILVARIVNRQPTTAAQQIPIPFRLVQNQQQRAQAQQQSQNPQAARQASSQEQQVRARQNAKEQIGPKKM